MIQAVTGGVRAEPMPIPPIVMPIPKPRSCGGCQFAIDRLKLGRAAASPMPMRNLTTASEPIMPIRLTRGRVGARAVSAVKIDHQMTAKVKTRRGPHRSPIHPPGT